MVLIRVLILKIGPDTDPKKKKKVHSTRKTFKCILICVRLPSFVLHAYLYLKLVG